jgi:hypothetical protein
VVRDKFRGKFLATLRKALREGKIQLPEGMRPAAASLQFIE